MFGLPPLPGLFGGLTFGRLLLPPPRFGTLGRVVGRLGNLPPDPVFGSLLVGRDGRVCGPDGRGDGLNPPDGR